METFILPVKILLVGGAMTVSLRLSNWTGILVTYLAIWSLFPNHPPIMALCFMAWLAIWECGYTFPKWLTVTVGVAAFAQAWAFDGWNHMGVTLAMVGAGLPWPWWLIGAGGIALGTRAGAIVWLASLVPMTKKAPSNIINLVGLVTVAVAGIWIARHYLGGGPTETFLARISEWGYLWQRWTSGWVSFLFGNPGGGGYNGILKLANDYGLVGLLLVVGWLMDKPWLFRHPGVVASLTAAVLFVSLDSPYLSLIMLGWMTEARKDHQEAP